MSISRRGTVTPSTPFFPISISQKQLNIYLLFRMSLTYGYKNLYFHPYTFDERKKSFSYLTSLSRRGTVNPSTSTFGNINITETMTKLIAALKFNQNGCKDLYLHPRPFKSNFKLNSFLMSHFRCGLVNPSTPTFSGIDLAKTIRNYLLFRMSLKNGCNNHYFYPYTFNMSYKWFPHLTSLSCRGPVDPSTPIFGNINLTEATNVIFLLLGNSIKNNFKNLYLHNPLRLPSNQVQIWH